MNDGDASVPATVPKVAILISDGFQLLDASGPLAVFELAGLCAQHSYEVRFVAPVRGSVQSSAGISVTADGLGMARHCQTLIVSGGAGVEAASRCEPVLRLLRRASDKGVRIASVCTGAFILAAAGLLDGKAATTHWSRGRDLCRQYPAVRLEADRIYVRSGGIWTSAGISAGIDLALALLAEDCGEEVARRVARELVVPFRRLGGQSQFSVLAEMQRFDGRFASLLHDIRADLAGDLGVEALAARAMMSPRNFARAFVAETGVSPAKAVERLRCETARALLDGGTSVKATARTVGFGDTERMRRAFARTYGAAPAFIRESRLL